MLSTGASQPSVSIPPHLLNEIFLYKLGPRCSKMKTKVEMMRMHTHRCGAAQLFRISTVDTIVVDTCVTSTNYYRAHSSHAPNQAVLYLYIRKPFSRWDTESNYHVGILNPTTRHLLADFGHLLKPVLAISSVGSPAS